MATNLWLNIGSGNDLLPDGTKLLPEPMLNFDQSGYVVAWDQFYSECPSCYSV